MTNTFEIAYRDKDEWKSVLALYPFTYADLLDERLDEATVTVFSRVPCFLPMTVFRVILRDADGAHEVYYSLASDNSPQYIPGRGVYKHTLYLIEYTKTLEGILCQTLTFTNDLGRIYTDASLNLYPTDIDDGEWPTYTTIDDILSSFEYNPDTMQPPTFASILTEGAPLYIPSINDMASFFKAYENVVEPSYSPWRVVSETYDRGTQVTASININNNGVNTQITSLVQGETITPKGYVTIKYKIILRPLLDDTGYTNDRVMYFGWDLIAVRNQYPLKPWTITDVTNRCLDLAEPLYGDEKPRFVLDEEDAEKYENVLAPEFTMTACTLREQLKAIGGYIHAEPRLVWPNVEQTPLVIKFEPVSQQGRALVDAYNVPYTYRENSININEYCTSLRSNAANLVQSLAYGVGTMSDPATGTEQSSYRSVRTETVYARIVEGNAVIATQYPIYSIEDVHVGIDDFLTPVSVKNFVFEETEYAANLKDTYDVFPLSKAYAIYYTRGQKNIKGMYYKAEQTPSVFVPDAFKNKYSISLILSNCTEEKTLAQIDSELVSHPQWLIAQVTYRPIYPALLSHSKPTFDANAPAFEKIYQQSENLLESLYFGENIKGVAARLGNVQEQRTYVLSRLGEIPRLSETVGGLSVSGVKVELLSSYIRATVDLTKDYNRISEYVGIDSQKRVYEVSERNTYDRSVLLHTTILVGGDSLESDASPFSLDLSTVAELFEDPTDATQRAVSNAILKSYDIGGNLIGSQYLPVVSSAIGNAMLFSLAMKDNYSAGTSSIYTALQGGTEAYGYFSTDVPYADIYGRIHSVHVALSSVPAEYTGAQNPEFFMPNGQGASYTGMADIVMDEAARYLVRKDNRERLSYNIEIEYRSAAEEIVVGSALAYLCGLVNRSYASSPTADTPRLYLFRKQMNELGITKFTRQILTLPTVTNDAFFVFNEGDNGHFSIDKDKVDGRCTSFNLTQNGTPQFDDVDTVYGWCIATPVKTQIRTVSNEAGGTTTETVYTGGDVLLMSTKTYVKTLGNDTPDIFENCKFVFKND